ncbi:MAG: GAF domain-containing sensor histidine kinase [Solirubrobacteraceae bacterium]|nr:GAF domain-containing sensor histidine kinase [Solirubrobacteraceae bacterium]
MPKLPIPTPAGPPQGEPTDGQRQRAERAERLLAAGQALTSELELANVLQRILETARELTGASYAALGVLDERRQGLSDFITIGLEESERMAIGDPPEGHGILGLLIEHPVPLRLHDVSQHPRSYGFPVGHPPMKSFLGAPITIRDDAWGNLYLTDKAGAEDFHDHDVETITVLAQWAAVAIDNAKLFGEATDRRRSLERALRASRTSMEIATAIGADTDLSRILELIVKRGRALVEADSVLIWLRRGDELHLAAAAGNAQVPPGLSLPINASTAGKALTSGQSMRITDMSQLRVDPRQYGMEEASSVLLVPLVHRGQRHGVLVAFDRLGATASFDDEDQRTLEAFAISAATAVATARSVEEQRLQNSMAAAESERQRWARELHDETLQGMAALKLALTSALRAEPDAAREVLQCAVAQLDADIRGLRAIIADLRPAALDELGLEPALRALVDRVAENGGLQTSIDVQLGGVRLTPELETAAYRVAQEALTNVVKHAGATSVSVVAEVRRGCLHIRVADDGRGVGEHPGKGFGVIGMRERADLANGTLTIDSRSSGGTAVELELPL